jgi:carbon monoxide dehydrogenase subunit G
MKLSGEATLNASVDQVYAALNDPAMLVRTIPGCQRLEQVGADSYRATITAGVASIKGTFDGDVRLTDQDAPHSFTLHASGVGAPGTVTAVTRVTLAVADGATTRLTYDSDATIGGAIGGVGQRMITGVARKTAGEFFAAVDRELAVLRTDLAPALAESGVAEPVGAVAIPVAEPAVVSAAPSVASPAAPPPASPAAARAIPPAAVPPAGSPAPAAGVWTAPAPVVDPARQRVRELLLAATFGAIVALLGVLVGVIAAGR